MDALGATDLAVEQSAPSTPDANSWPETTVEAPPWPATLKVVAPTPPRPAEAAPQPAPIAESSVPDTQHPARRLMQAGAKGLATLSLALVAILMALVVWDYYVTAPWTRDGRVRVQVASVAPQVSGQITEVRVGDNQYVHKGDVLYVIDPFDFRVAVQSAKALLEQKAADVQVKQVQSERRQ